MNVELAHRPAPSVLLADDPREVFVGYTIGVDPGSPASQYGGHRLMPSTDALAAVVQIVEDLAVSPEALVVREIACDGNKPVLMLRAFGGKPGRVVAIVSRGLTTLDLNLALLRLTPAGVA